MPKVDFGEGSITEDSGEERVGPVTAFSRRRKFPGHCGEGTIDGSARGR